MSLYPPPFERPAFNEMQTWLFALYQYVTTGGANFDPRAYGATTTASAATNATAFQAAINACEAAGGGGVLIPPGAFNIAGRLTVTGDGVTIFGVGRGVSILRQTTLGADGLVIGANGALCNNFVLRDVTLDGNSKAARLLRMNNCINAVVERVYGSDADYGLYMEGQNESHTFRDVNMINFTVNGILAGVSNGTAISAGYDYPELQKCLFERIRIGACEGTAIKITAGIIDGGQSSSGVNRFERILLEGNRQNGIEVHFSFQTAISGFSNEDIPRTNGVYYPLVIEDGSFVSMRDAYFSVGQGGHDYAAKVHLNGGWLYLSDSSVSGAHASVNGDIVVDGGKLDLHNVIITDKSAIVYGSAAAQNAALLSHVFDASGNPILDFTSADRYVSPGTEGIYLPQAVINTLVLENLRSAGLSFFFLRSSSGDTLHSVNFGDAVAANIALIFDGSSGLKIMDGTRANLAELFAKHFYPETRQDYTVTNPVVRRSMDVSSMSLADLREYVGTLTTDLIAVGLLQ